MDPHIEPAEGIDVEPTQGTDEAAGRSYDRIVGLVLKFDRDLAHLLGYMEGLRAACPAAARAPVGARVLDIPPAGDEPPLAAPPMEPIDP